MITLVKVHIVYIYILYKNLWELKQIFDLQMFKIKNVPRTGPRTGVYVVLIVYAQIDYIFSII